ncbi:MAG: diphthine--ammonia ligase [Ignavibacteria bacterium]|nr:diphthine--ammonia ligase [Ignavibacteria bacterium]
MQKQKAIFNWSGGKDSALCLCRVLTLGEYDVSCLLTSVNEQYQRISMHGVRIELLEQQAASIGIPLVKMLMPEMPDMKTYETIMKETLIGLKNEGMEVCIFGDIFLEDLRKYRENKLAEMNLRAIFPLWKIPTNQLIREFIDLEFQAVVVCVNDKFLDGSFVGRVIDDSFLKNLPDNVDPCGEYGEFHSFVYDGPIFKEPIDFKRGEKVYRKYSPRQQDGNSQYDCNSSNFSPFDSGFWYGDLLPVSEVGKTV